MNKIRTLFRFSNIKETIPIIDLAPYLHGRADWRPTAELIRKACKEIGFFYVVNHGVSR
jgi:isopenicillin N synthase-like dioxygenase